MSFKGAAIDSLTLNSWISEQGQLNLTNLLVPQTRISTSQLESNLATLQNPPEAETASDWQVSLEQLQLNNLAANFEDRSLSTPANLGAKNLNLTAQNLSTQPGTLSPFNGSVQLLTGGDIQISGNATLLPDLLLDAELKATDIQLKGVQSYISEFAKVRINSGAVDADVTLKSEPAELLDTRGNITVAGFSAQDLVTNSELLRWKSLLFDDFAYDLSAAKLEISRLLFTEPYARLLIAKDQSTNFGDVIIATPADSAEPKPTESSGNELELQIGEIDLRNGSADFADNSLPLPFAASIKNVKGDISTVSTVTTEPTSVVINGQVDEYGAASVNGKLLALDPLQYTDIAVVFDNINMPTLSPYTAEFVGRRIQNGKLNVELDYEFENSQMLGQNSVVLSEFTLGDKVDSENAVNLPLGLAVALLKDKDGIIDLNLEVTGDVDDPDFSISAIVLKAFGTLVTKVVTSPFRALGGLVDDDIPDLDTLEFADGTADLTPPDREKLAALGQALTERPELTLIVPPTLDQERDRKAAQQAAVAARVDAQMSIKEQRDETPDMFVRRQRKVLENLYKASVENADLKAIKQDFTRPLEAGARPKLDEVAYSAELRRRLVERELISDQQLESLAAERAQRTVNEILLASESLSNRILIGEPVITQSTDPQWVLMKMALEANP